MPPAPQLDYGQLVERALRRVVHDALQLVAEHGFPGQHHFYVTFRTDHPDVVVGDALRARYPSEMTIVLQHEFWGLEVGADGFAVTLSFNSVGERLEIPFEAVRVFADPSVEFGLQFTVPEAPGEVAAPVAIADVPASATETSASAPDPASAEASGAEVVALDRFRKK